MHNQTPKQIASNIYQDYVAISIDDEGCVKHRKIIECCLVTVNAIIDSWSQDEGAHFEATKNKWEQVRNELIKSL